MADRVAILSRRFFLRLSRLVSQKRWVIPTFNIWLLVLENWARSILTFNLRNQNQLCNFSIQCSALYISLVISCYSPMLKRYWTRIRSDGSWIIAVRLKGLEHRKPVKPQVKVCLCRLAICCVLREQFFFSIRTDWSFLLVINFSKLEPARISCHTVAIKNLLKNYNNNKNKTDKTNERFL